ncbi:helix-turn-helix domain-containing protein [Pseudobutyrivibrio xylanivorans]|uniref:Looped-hinge helix DNA binding domain-containing protein, AbrB family n=1 Tax=Pseudobutyrivibrio xylanivorans TaxID=185007 RepID=A0A1G5RTS0_PSEXY|nr:helix-turn-helix domain-containing protein [Pseudobutyrivibrio xylanivorans]SCZ77512.1 looped-hinge helix DNA binding domain-containing protein, AbrB family [Pseudobutyrivibrio xylanivorans]
MFSENLVQMRKFLSMTQEELAEKVGVTRQSIAKWEAGDSLPDLEKSKLLAEVLGVSLDELANHEPEDNLGLGLAPKGKYLFGMVTVGDKGQIVIPAKARKIFNISPGDSLVVLGDEDQGIALMKSDYFLNMANMVSKLPRDNG